MLLILPLTESVGPVEIFGPQCLLAVVALAGLGPRSGRPLVGRSQLIFQRLAFGLYATDLHDWKLGCCLLSALGKDQSSAHDGTAIRWSARLAKLA